MGYPNWDVQNHGKTLVLLAAKNDVNKNMKVYFINYISHTQDFCVFLSFFKRNPAKCDCRDCQVAFIVLSQSWLW